MPRYRLIIEYDGGPFVGWQRQANGPSVQAAVEAALVRFVGRPVAVTAAGRTDAGVHAAGQVAHLDLPAPRSPAVIRDAINFHLRPWPVAVLAAEPVGATFHARFSAIRRRYRYRIVNRKPPLALDAGRAWRVPVALDDARMAAAAALLVGHHDFTSFRSVMCQAPSPVKTLERLEVRRCGELIEIVVEARSFLHNQVRILAGTLKRVGDGGWSVERVAAALAARDRRRGGPTAPACGLCLIGVDYPPSAEAGGDQADEVAEGEVGDDDGGGDGGADAEGDAGDEPGVGEDEADRQQPQDLARGVAREAGGGDDEDR